MLNNLKTTFNFFTVTKSVPYQRHQYGCKELSFKDPTVILLLLFSQICLRVYGYKELSFKDFTVILFLLLWQICLRVLYPRST